MTREELRALFALLEEAPMFVSLLEGPELRVTMVNRRVREFPRPVLGKTASGISTDQNPALVAARRAYETGAPETIDKVPQYDLSGAQPDRFFTRNFVPIRNPDGTMMGVLVLAYEVTDEVRARQAQQETERRGQLELQRLAALLDEAPVFIAVLEGPELRVVMRNRALRELLGPVGGIGTTLPAMVQPDNTTLQAARRAHDTGVAETLDVVVRDVAGFVGRSFSTTVVRLPDVPGEPRRVMTVSFETTARRRAQEALEAQARELEAARRAAVQASRAKDEFLAMLGHELRNPLAPIVTTLQLMRMRGTAGAEVDLLDRQVQHLIRLVDDLLDVSRITRGVVELKRRGLELAMVVNRALEMTGPLLEKRRQRIVSDLAPAAVHGDLDRLAQVAANVIANASKYSDVGSPIRIQTEQVGEVARIKITDAGIGIAPEMLDRIFDAFVQQPQTLERSSGGLGLGLSIARGLVEAHGGTVSAHSDGLGHGSTFVIDLPAIASPGAADAASPERLRPSPQALRILVVDDNRDAAAALGCALRALGHAVVVAHDGPSALAEAEAFEPHIGLLDIGLPGMNGYELAAALRSGRTLRLIAITGYDQPRDRERAHAAGFEAHLVKPVTLEQITAVLHAPEPVPA